MAGMASPPDDLEAVRSVVDALKGFPTEEQRRILRWAQEKLGLSPAVPSATAQQILMSARSTPSLPEASTGRGRDIKTFVELKRPASDVQFATVVAYYFAFEAPEGEKKTEISAVDLQDAARLSARARPTRPINTLHNASKQGYLDKGGARGSFKINTVGENLVAMAMPGVDAASRPARKASGQRGRRVGSRKSAKQR